MLVVDWNLLYRVENQQILYGSPNNLMHKGQLVLMLIFLKEIGQIPKDKGQHLYRPISGQRANYNFLS